MGPGLSKNILNIEGLIESGTLAKWWSYVYGRNVPKVIAHLTSFNVCDHYGTRVRGRYLVHPVHVLTFVAIMELGLDISHA